MAILTEEQTMIRDGARSWIENRAPVKAFRKMRDSGATDGFDRETWREIAEMGWAGILVPEAYGGTALGYVTMGLVLEETARTLTASPLLSSALIGVTALMRSGNEAQQAAYLPRIAEGGLITALAVDEGTRHAPDKIALPATRSDDGFRLNGVKNFVIDGASADLFIVAARVAAGQGLTLFLVAGDAVGVSRERLSIIDSRGYANIRFEDSPAELLGEEGQGDALLEAILDRARIGVAAEMIGQATQSFEATVEYLKTRIQFDRPIGSFQALQHRAAKMFTDLELARSCVEAALAAADAEAQDVRELASLAKAKAGDVAHLISNEMIQMHGGIGMTDEHDAGLYLKRARVLEALFGNQAYHRDRYATLGGY